MFRIEFFVDDKKLGNALHALVGIAHGQPNVQPVSNVQKRGNGVVALTKGGTPEQFVSLMRKMKRTQVDSKQAGEMLKKLGLSATSSNYLLKRITNAGLLQKTGNKNNAIWHFPAKG